MATSFKALRQYEKIGLIILGVVVMIVFTMGDFFSYSGRSKNDGSSAQKGTRVVSWNSGSLTQGQIEQIASDHRNVIEVEREILRQISLDKKNPAQPKVQPVMEARADELINRYIFSTYASNIGLIVDDEAVKTFLKKLSGDRLDMADIKTILDETVGDTPEARTRFFSWMRRELASKAVERMIFSAQSGVAPDGAWNEYKDMTQRAQIEFLALPTKSYMTQVKDDPSQADLQKLYDELKSKYRLVDYPDNGLRQAEQVAFGYVKADFETFVKAEMKNVTDKQVEEYYEKNKTKYRQPVKPPVQPPATEEEKKAEVDKKEEGKTEDSKPDGEKSATETPETPKQETPPATEPNNNEAPKAEPEKKEPPKDEPAKPTDPTTPPKSEETPANPKEDSQDLSLISFRSTQEPKDPVTEKAQEKPPVEEKKPEAPAGQEPTATPTENATDKKPADATASQEKPADPAANPTEEKPAAPQEEFRPLTEVAENIRRDIAAPTAEKAYNDEIQKAETELRALWKKVNLGEGKINKEELKKFDFEAFAAKHQFTLGSIPLSPPDVVQKDKDGLGGFPGFLDQAFFTDRSLLYEPRTIRNQFMVSAETYIYWRTEQKDEFEPKFAECQEDLENAYRYRKAKELAKEDAKKKAAEVKVGKTLKDTFPKENVLVTGEFTYTTPFSRGRVGQIPEIPNAGETFMKEVFKLQPGQATSIAQADEAQFYVVYLSKYGFTEKELREQFANFPIIAELAQTADAKENANRMAAYNEFLDTLDRKFEGQTTPEEE